MKPMRQVSTLLLTMVGEAPCCSRNTRLQLWKLLPLDIKFFKFFSILRKIYQDF